jgi:hypothetical protein
MRSSMLSLIIIFVLFAALDLQGAKVLLPDDARDNKIFLVKIIPEATDNAIELTFDATKLQYMGSLQATSDIQIVIDGTLEIRPGSGGFAEAYELKFSSNEKDATSAGFCVKSGELSEDCIIVFTKSQDKNYSWFYLFGGIILIFVARSFWKYQKNSPAMMSTKSLFLNYEEIQKARKKYEGSEQKETLDDPLPKEEKGVEKLELAPEATEAASGIGAKTEIQSLKVGDEGQGAHKAAQPEDEEHDAPTKELRAVPENRAVEQAAKAVGQLIEVVLEANGATYEAKAGPIKVGRRNDNHLVISASEVSREHAELYVEGGVLLVKPLSANVTRVNGKDVKGSSPLVAGDVLNLGGTDFVVVKAKVH